MRVGFYKDDLEDPVSFYDPDDHDVIECVAKDFAEENHEIDEDSDMNFTVYVEDKYGYIQEVKFYTEYDPRFEIEAINRVISSNTSK
tara:strand:- start:166 stop:426 length:261 start_codon:yes stop_codon:yes gene_type:complete